MSCSSLIIMWKVQITSNLKVNLFKVNPKAKSHSKKLNTGNKYKLLWWYSCKKKCFNSNDAWKV